MSKSFHVNSQVPEFQLKMFINMTVAEYVHHIDPQKSIYVHQESHLCSLEIQRQSFLQKSSVTVFSLKELRTTCFSFWIQLAAGTISTYSRVATGFTREATVLSHSLLQFEEVQSNDARIVILPCKHNWKSVSKKSRKIHSSHLLPKGFFS